MQIEDIRTRQRAALDHLVDGRRPVTSGSAVIWPAATDEAGWQALEREEYREFWRFVLHVCLAVVGLALAAIAAGWAITRWGLA